ncbi:MAG: pirin family protein [Pseudomonadota bacterium]
MTTGNPAIELALRPKTKDLGGFSVRRVLPSARQRMVGLFVFFDEMGPASFPPGQGIDVRPHPHIGLATVTYLFEGQILHRDSLGYVQPIERRAVNLMTAGRGIVHSERAGDDLDQTSALHGIQSWMALPDEAQEVEPAFVHYPADTIPEVAVGGAAVRVIIGEAFGVASPVHCYSPTLYLEFVMPAGSAVTLPADWPQRALYVVAGNVEIAGEPIAPGTMTVLAAGHAASIAAGATSRVMAIGGAPVGERHIWWNFVSNSRARIDAAKADWKAGRFAAVPDDDEFIPLPE